MNIRIFIGMFFLLFMSNLQADGPKRPLVEFTASAGMGNFTNPSKFDTSYLHVPSPIVDQYTEQLRQAQDLEEIQSISSQAAGELNFNQKVRVVANLEKTYLAHYDRDRTDQEHPNSFGVVTLEQLHACAQNNTKCGVCRDMAVGGAQIFKMMGVESYVLAYAHTGGSHATTVAQDPDNPKNVVKLNYDYVYGTDDEGTRALVQDTVFPNMGFQYRMYDSDGRPVANLPTSFGIALDSTLPMIKGAPFAISGNLKDGGVRINLGRGSMLDGSFIHANKVTGETDHQSEIDSISAGGNLGLRLGPIQSNTYIGVNTGSYQTQRSIKTAEMDYVYVAIRQEINTVARDVGHGIKISMQSAVQARQLDGEAFEHLNSNPHFIKEGSVRDFKVDMEAGATVSWTGINSSLNLTGHTIYFVALDDIRDAQDAESMHTSDYGWKKQEGLHHNYTMIKLNYDKKIPFTKEDVRGFIESTIVMRTRGLGDRGRFDVGIKKHGQFSLYGGIDTPLNIYDSPEDEVPTWLPGAQERTYRFGLRYEWENAPWQQQQMPSSYNPQISLNIEERRDRYNGLVRLKLPF
ncbi:MAG: hypothetical protein ISR65_03720 [Bacteriovoracaceae bacterium]|nr:hypothetical protein [Bacteriovoracaceae bacterium]